MAIGTNLAGTGAGTATQGQRVATDVSSSRRIPGWDGKTVDISANVCPLVMLVKKFGSKSKPVSNAAGTFFHLETDSNPFHVEVNGAQNDSDTSLEVTAGHGARVIAGSLLLCERTGEVMLVSDRSTDTLTISRGHGGSTAAALLDDEELMIMGTAFADGTAAPAGRSYEPTLKTNYCQIFKDAFDLSGRAIESENYGPDERQRIQEKTGDNIHLQMELSLLFCPIVSASSPNTTGGLPYWIVSNRVNRGGALTEIAMVDWLYDCARRNYGDDGSCVLIAGENARKSYNQFLRDNIEYRPDDNMVGANCSIVDFGTGPVKVMSHGLLSSLGSGVSPTVTGSTNLMSGGHGGYQYYLNLKNLGERTFKNRALKMTPDIETPGTDGKKWGYICDRGWHVSNEKSHGIMMGITAPAA